MRDTITTTARKDENSLLHAEEANNPNCSPAVKDGLVKLFAVSLDAPTETVTTVNHKDA